MEKVHVSQGRSLSLFSKLPARPRPDFGPVPAMDVAQIAADEGDCLFGLSLPSILEGSSFRSFMIRLSARRVHVVARRTPLFLLFRLPPFLLTAVRFHRVVSKRHRRPLLPSSLHLVPPFYVVPLTDMICKVCARACVCEKRERMIEKYRSPRRFTFQPRTLLGRYLFLPRHIVFLSMVLIWKLSA